MEASEAKAIIGRLYAINSKAFNLALDCDLLRNEMNAIQDIISKCEKIIEQNKQLNAHEKLNENKKGL
jgi:hypothetical protein